MRFLSVRELRNRPGAVWKSLAKDDVVVTNNGRPVGVLIGVDDETFEESMATLQRLRAQRAVTRLRQSASRSGAARWPRRRLAQEIARARRA